MSCIICIPCRNVAIYLEKVFKNIDKLNTFFNNFEVCFFYDKSDDNTLKVLNIYIKNKKYRIEIIINNEELKKNRTQRIAVARNRLIKHISEMNIKPDYFIMMDCDEICSYPINIDSLKYHINLNNWDALSFNRTGLPNGHENYDIWALQYEPFIHHCHSYYGDLSVVFIMRDDITKKLNDLKKGELFECYSAFNGFAIYKTKKFLNCVYDGEKQKHFSNKKINNMLKLINQKYNLNLKINFDFVDVSHGGGKQNCEHIHFHLDAIRNNNAKIRISGERIFDNY
jgi:hypothetical protein